MALRSALITAFAALLAGCVSTGHVDPLKTQKGRNEARDAYIQLGLGYLTQGQSESATVPLSKALELDPNSADAHAALALVFQTQMEPELADEHYRKALSQRSDDARILNNYGSFLYEQKRYPEAYERFQKASQDTLYPERSRIFQNLGLTALAMGHRDEAQQYFERAVRLDPQQPRALLELAQMAYEGKQYVPARGYYQRFSALSAQSARSLLLGIHLAKVFDDRDTAASYGLQLKRLYPASREYQQYQTEQ